MMRVIDNTINYFSPKRDYFWKWAENASVIEWRTQSATICYRDDLAYILRQFPEKLPRLGSVLLVMYACNNEIAVAEQFALRSMLGKERTVHVGRVKNAIDFLNMIHTLPPSFRSGTRRIQLVKEIFNDEKSLEIESSSISINELQSGRMDARLMDPQGYTEVADVMADLNCLIRASEKFPTYESLELFLKAGVESLPEPPAIEIPEEKHFNDLFDELLEDPETAGVSRLARRLLSVIHIPIHARAGGEDSYGGIADITNRGNYDKLLLSELAQDELLLTARLVNNEALYFRREEPPAKPRNKRVLLIDASIKMWGMPRVYAIAAALAFSRNSKHGEQIEAYVLKETMFEKISLADKAGVIDALTQLHPALHPGKALVCAVRELSNGEETEFILFTEERQLKHAGFYADFFKVKEKISFAITVDREGDIRFAEYSNGLAKVLNEAKLDLHEMLHPPEKKAAMQGTKYSKLTERPLDRTTFAFFAKPKLPLLMPKKRAAMKETLMGSDADGSIVLVDRNNRVLRLSSSNRGARELLDHIEQGQYFMQTLSSSLCCIAVLAVRGFVKVYRINLENGEVVQDDLSMRVGGVYEAHFADDEHLYLISGQSSYKYDIRSMQMANESAPRRDNFPSEKKVDLNFVAQLFRSPVFTGIFKTHTIYINAQRRLVFASQCLELNGSTSQMMISRERGNNKLIESSSFKEDFFRGTHIKYRKMEWPDGSIAVLDKRGLLHLKSSNPSIPEITIVAVGTQATSAWSSDNIVAGNQFFFDPKQEHDIISDRDFYTKYIEKYINHIINHAHPSSI